MGKWNGTKRLVEDFQKITISSLGLKEHLNAAMAEDVVIFLGPPGNILFMMTLSLKDKNDQHLILQYASVQPSERRQEFECEIPLVSTPCQYGGIRLWFRCPFTANGQKCGRRVAILYKDGDRFACRDCCNLTYKSRNLSGIDKKAGATNVTLVEADQILSNCRYYKGRPTKRYGRMKKMEEKVLKNIELRSARTNERFQKFMDQYNKFIQKETRKRERLEREAQEYLRRRSMDQAADGKSGFLVDQGTGPKSP